MFQTLLPSVGPGALKNREDPNERAGKVTNTVRISFSILITYGYVKSLLPYHSSIIVF